MCIDPVNLILYHISPFLPPLSLPRALPPSHAPPSHLPAFPPSLPLSFPLSLPQALPPFHSPSRLFSLPRAIILKMSSQRDGYSMYSIYGNDTIIFSIKIDRK